MVKRNVVVLCLFLVLIVGTILEQDYTDSSYETINSEVLELKAYIQNQDEQSKVQIEKIESFWKQREIVLSLFVDYRDIEQIGREVNLIKSYLENLDYELAIVECNLLLHIVSIYHSTVSFDWQNII